MSGEDDRIEPYEPLDVLKPVAPDIWIVDGPVIDFSYLGLTLPFPTRMTVVRLRNGSLWLHSPTTFDETLADALERLGPITHIIAPNTLHYWYVPDWAERFPAATRRYAPGLDAKAKRPLPPGETLGANAPSAWAEEIDQVVIEGDLLNEVDFFHRSSRTLILTDLIENFEPKRVKSWLFRQALRLSGAADPDGSAPIDMRLTFVRHTAEVRAAVERMIAFQPERVIVAHGRWYETDGAAELHRAFRWVL